MKIRSLMFGEYPLLYPIGLPQVSPWHRPSCDAHLEDSLRAGPCEMIDDQPLIA